jgi:hypothetical protein
VVGFVAKSWRASSPNIRRRVQSENARDAKFFKTSAAKILAKGSFCIIENHRQNLLQLANQADNAVVA